MNRMRLHWQSTAGGWRAPEQHCAEHFPHGEWVNQHHHDNSGQFNRRIVNSTSSSATGTYSVLLTVPIEGVYTITAVAHDLINGSITKLRVVTVDTTAPNVTLNTQNDSWTNSNQGGLNFTFNDALSATASCSLFIDGAPYNASLSASSGIPATIAPNATLADGAHAWYVNCTDCPATREPPCRT